MERQEILSVLSQANNLIRTDRSSEALELLEQLDAPGKEGGAVAFMRGNAYLQMGEDQQAHLCYGEALNQGFVSKRLYINLGVVKTRLGNVLQAEMMFRQAADLDPTDALPLNRILLLRLGRGDFDGAEAVMDELMRRNPELVDGYHHKADLLLGTGRVQEALELLTGAADRFSSNSLYLYDLCRALRRNGKTEGALELLEAHQDDFRSETELLLFKKQKAQLLVDLKRYAEALPLWQELYDLFGDRQSGMALAAQALSEGDMETLYRIADEMISSETYDESHYMCLYYKAVALRQLGDEAAAREAFSQAGAQLDQLDGEQAKDPRLCGLRISVRMELGRYEDMLADIESLSARIRESGDTPENIEKALRNLEEVKKAAQERAASFV